MRTPAGAGVVVSRALSSTLSMISSSRPSASEPSRSWPRSAMFVPTPTWWNEVTSRWGGSIAWSVQLRWSPRSRKRTPARAIGSDDHRCPT